MVSEDTGRADAPACHNPAMGYGSRAGVMVSAVLAAVATTLLLAGCGQARPVSTLASCRAFGEHAIEQHVVVRAVPGACAGLTRLQINQSVVEAVRAAAGRKGKAASRRVAAADARYLAGLVAELHSPASSGLAASGSAPAGDGLRIAALVSWVVTASAGAYLLLGLRRRSQTRRRLPALAIGHATAAIAGLGTWAAFASAGEQSLAWAAAILAFAAAGLGMAVLVGSAPDSSARLPQPGSGPGPRRVLVIAAHGILAAVTLALVLYAAVA
jgi:hypothetical protein